MSNAIGKLKLSGRSGSVGYAVGDGSGSYSVSYDAAECCKFSSTSNRPLGIESGKSLSWNWDIGKLNAFDHRAAIDAAVSGRARLCDMSFSYAPVGNSLSSAGVTGSMSGAVDSQSSSIVPVGGTATANVGNVPSNASISYQWYTVDSNGSYSAIANANGKTLKVLAAYRGKDIVCRVSDSSGHYSGYVETTRKPVRNLAPKVGISGSSVYGGKLTAAASGLPSGATYTYKYRWQRLSGSSWVDIANATAAEYTLGGEDVGKQARVVVSTASNIYTVDDVSAVSATVAKAKASIGVSISGAKNNSSRLTASVSGLPAAGANTVSYRWQRSSDGKSNWVDSTAGDAKSNSIQMQPNDVSWHYRCIVSASNPYYDIVSSTSAAYGPIAKSTVSAVKATISGNAVYGGTIKANVTNVPTVGTNSISYQWQYSEDGKAWNDTRLDGGKTSSLVLSAVSCVGTQYRCVISVDNSYYIVPGCTTGDVKVGKASAQAIAKASGEAVAGKKLTVAVSGLPTVGGTNNVSYQWQSSTDGKTWGASSLTGAKTSTLCLYDDGDVTHNMVGYSFRCIVSVSGNSTYDIKSATSNVVGPVVKGTAAAPSVSVGGTKKIESALKATVTGLPKYGNNNVLYQWQTSADGSKWVDSAQSDAKSVSFKPAYSLVNQYVRCAVSVSNDQYNVATGYSAAFGKLGKASKTISAAITSPNKRNGDTLTCGISGLASNGSNTLTYKWECTNNSAFTSNVEVMIDKGNTHVTSVGTGTYYRCTVTASNPYYEYNTAVSSVYGPLAKGVASAPTATVNGSNAWGSTLKATVTGLPKYGNSKISYQWEARDDSATTWGNSSYATATTDHITVDAQDAVSKARHYRCKVTVDNDQYTVPVAYSADHGKTVKASATAKASISGTAAVGGKLTCSVSGLPTSGSNSVSYQWQYSNDNRTWTNSTYTDAKASSHSLGYKDAYNLYWRCSVSVSNPYYSVPTAYTDSRLCGKGTSSIAASISGNAVIGGKLTCSVGGLPSIGTNSVKYRWQYSSDGKAWTDSANATSASNSITLPPDAATLGKYFRCVVSATNDVYNDMSATSAASAKVGKGNHSAPSVSISGAKVYGSTLTASVSGQSTGTTGTSYQWQRADAANGTYANIANATGMTYSVGTADMNKYLRVLINTANTYYSVSQGVSAGYGPIGKASHAAPSVSVSGDKSVGATLTANVSGQPGGTTSTTYQWQRASSASGSYSNIANATGKTYKTVDADANKYLRVLVNTANTYYTVSQGVSAGYGAILVPKSFAIYSDGDKSLKFYRRASVPAVASTFNGQPVTALYENIESTSYTSVPWSSRMAQIAIVDIVDSGIKPTNIAGWFSGASALAKMDNISKLDVSATKDMSYAFSGCESLTKINLSSWNTASCTNMSYMFSSCKHLMQINVSSFRTSSVTDFSDMFYQCLNITDLDVSSFDTRNAKSIALMMAETLHMQRFKVGANFKIVNTNFVGTPSSINIPDCDSRWHSSTGGIYTSATIPSLKADTYYALANRTCVQQAYAVYSIDDNSLSFYKRSDVPDIGHIFNGKTATDVYPNLEAYDDTTLYHASPWSSQVAYLRTAKVVDSGIQPRSTAWWFYFCTAMTTCDLSKLDTSKCVNMCWMFRSCSSLTTLDVSKFDTHLVTDLSSMFRDSPELGELDVRNWNVSRATNMGNMFNSCRRLTDLTGAENWNTSSNEHFDHMFANCVQLTLDASRWDTSAAKGASKHTGFNLSAYGVKAPYWHGLLGRSATSVENDSNPDMPSDDIAVDSADAADSKSTCDMNGNSDTAADGTIDDSVDNSDNTENADSVDSDIENRQSSDDGAVSNEPLPGQSE